MRKYLIICALPFYILSDISNAFIERYPDSNDLLKINIAVKDNIDVKGKVTSAGSLALYKNVANEDAFIIKKLIQNNFHISGKTNLSEWANFRSTKSISGWSSLGGQTKHPLNPQYNPCGSSSGSAVAVASGLVNIAIGTETNGSITCPASVVGIVGMKPTVGLVSRSGIIPISESQDSAGPMGNSVEIVAKTLQAIAGFDPNDTKTKSIPLDFDFNLMPSLDSKNLKGKRFGLLSSGFDNKYGKEFLKILTIHINRLGAELVLIDDERIYPSNESYFLLLYEFKNGLESYLQKSSEQKKTLSEIIVFNKQNADKVMPYFGQEIFLASEKASMNLLKYQDAIKAIEESTRQTISLLDKYKLDAFIGLTRGPAWKIDYDGGDGVAMDKTLAFGNGGFSAISGLPHITIPYFKIESFPVGLSLIGRPWSDKDILSFAFALEQSK
tara:strand:+ start:562 stop:1887 length:1326 start_codon:yes stop_codon:yes gene_type:complete